MALNTDVSRSYVIQFCWIQNVVSGGMRHVLAAGAMAAFATYIPFGDLLGPNVVAH